MRILMLNYEFPPLGGGASSVSYEISRRLSEKSVKIDVVTMAFRDLPKIERISDNLVIYRVNCLRSKKEICYPWEQLTYLISGYFKSWQLIRKNKYSLIYTHFIIPTGVLAFVLKKQFDLKYIITSHGSDVIGHNPRFKYIYPLISWFWKIIIVNAEKITTGSKFLKEEILLMFKKLRPGKIEIIPYAIDENKFIPMKKDKYILLLSRLFINKGIQDFLEAVKNIDLKDWKIKIVGDGPYKTELENIVNKNGLNKKVEFLGWVDNKSKKMKEIMGKASIFVFPSWFESMSIVLLEAMSAGCAIIASDCGANEDTLGDTGLIYKTKDITSLRKKIETIIYDNSLINKIQKSTEIRVNKMFLWNIVVKKYKNLLINNE